MRLVFGLVLILGLGLAGFAVLMISNYIKAYETELAAARSANGPNVEMVEVFVADRTVQYGERLGMADVRLVKFPVAALPEGVFQTVEALFPKGEATPRTVLRTMERNEAVLDVKVTAAGEDAGITNKLERGMRAFAIDVDRTSGVSGFLRPGDRVDVYWTGNIGREGARTEANSSGEVTKLIETNIKLIAVDQVSNSDTTEAIIASTVTVMVKPQQVAALTQAQSTGRLSLSLVGAQDDTIAEAIEVDQRELLGLAAAPVVVERAEAEVCTIRTRRGAEVIETPIPCTN